MHLDTYAINLMITSLGTVYRTFHAYGLGVDEMHKAKYSNAMHRHIAGYVIISAAFIPTDG